MTAERGDRRQVHIRRPNDYVATATSSERYTLCGLVADRVRAVTVPAADTHRGPMCARCLARCDASVRPLRVGVRAEHVLLAARLLVEAYRSMKLDDRARHALVADLLAPLFYDDGASIATEDELRMLARRLPHLESEEAS